MTDLLTDAVAERDQLRFRAVQLAAELDVQTRRGDALALQNEGWIDEVQRQIARVEKAEVALEKALTALRALDCAVRYVANTTAPRAVVLTSASSLARATLQSIAEAA